VRLKILVASALLMGLTGSALRGQSKAPEVRFTGGTLRGRVQGGTAVFAGIPFAAPPVGNLRWREPQPVVAWSGVREVTGPGSPCIQSRAGVDGYLAPIAAAYHAVLETRTVDSSEDCLYLNVWSPEWPPRSRLLPVMVWLHGGSNRVGNGGEEGYDGTSLAAHGVIVVTLNYRLGLLGFFAHPALAAESPNHSTGNYGLLDQLAALRWVRENIEQFGGDPNNVTVFGESAGSIDATTLMTSPLARGLFRRVIAESGPAFGLGPETTLAAALAVGTAVGQSSAGEAAGGAAQIEALRKMGAADVAALEVAVIAAKFKGFDPNASIADGWLIPESPAAAFAEGKTTDIALLAGLNGRELSAFRLSAAAAAKKSGKPPEEGALRAAVKKLADAARPLYGSWTDLAVGMYLIKMVGQGDVAVDQASNDILVACPVGAEAALSTSAGARAYVYKFDRAVPGPGEATLGAFHALELAYVFDTFTSREWRWLPIQPLDETLSATMQTYWTNFAKTGDPNSPGLPPWRAWTSEKEDYLEFSRSGEVLPRRDFSPAFCHLSPERLKQQLGPH
jgi:para-nitrobenzyl esterase